jgi:uncharacterized protein (UPF0147 family)
MIELLATARDQDARPVFEKLSRDETLNRNVRDAARRALAVLRRPNETDGKPTAILKNNPQPSLT